MRKFYLTTAIAYTSAIPHIGNVYEAILADSICRYKRFKGFDVYFQTGTDEHGQLAFAENPPFGTDTRLERGANGRGHQGDRVL
jgi:hypothetical protein